MSDIQLGKPVGPTERFPDISTERAISRICFIIATLFFFVELFKLGFLPNPWNGGDIILIGIMGLFFTAGYKLNHLAARVERNRS